MQPLPITGTLPAHIRNADFPCVGAKAALAKQQLSVFEAGDLRCPSRDAAIHEGLVKAAGTFFADQANFRSFAVTFPGTPALEEAEIEPLFWQRLQALSDYDAACGFQPDERVSSDPASSHFAISFGGEAFFALLLHPRASRKSRRFPDCTIVFNIHQQFEALRGQGVYSKLRQTIIARDIALNGSRNPMLAEHGTASSARQYSGRAVEDDWQCPFSRKETSRNAA